VTTPNNTTANSMVIKSHQPSRLALIVPGSPLSADP